MGINLNIDVGKFFGKVKNLKCSTCNGRGKIKCKCIDISILGAYHYKNDISHIWSCSPSVENKGWPRNIKIKFCIYFTHTSDLLKSKTVKLNLPGFKTMHYENLIEIKLRDLKKLENKLGRPLRNSDFLTKLKMIDLIPLNDCGECKGKGTIKCPKCKGLRVRLKRY